MALFPLNSTILLDKENSHSTEILIFSLFLWFSSKTENLKKKRYFPVACIIAQLSDMYFLSPRY